MDGKPESVEFPEWEFLHNTTEYPLQDQDFSPQLPLIRPDHFSLQTTQNLSNSQHNSSSHHSSTDPSEVDRNFDDSYVASQLFPPGEIFLLKNQEQQFSSSNDSDSEADTKTATVAMEKTARSLSSEFRAEAGDGGGFDSKEEEELVVDSAATESGEGGEKEKRRVVWWKVPFEVFKYWVVRVSPAPVWSLSVAAAAAFLGLVILGRRLYKMKRKTQTLKLNVALDDKKVSQLMGHVARLNEAFSVVRRVPIVRPSLPASNVTLRPVMSMR